MVQVGGRDRTDLASAWAAAGIVLQMQTPALGELHWENSNSSQVFFLTRPSPSKLSLTVWCFVTKIDSVAA